MTAPKGSERVQFGSPDKHKGLARSPRGRVCDWADCETVLSTYNRSSRCSLHGKVEYIHPLKP
jgi:hypothetical protein